MATRATLNDVQLATTFPIRWRLREGVEPVEESYHILPEDKARLEAQAQQPATLTMEIDDHETLVIENLWIQDFPAGPNPHVATVRVTDRRWFWGRAHILRRYNMRRNIGTKRLLNPALPTQLDPIVTDVDFAKFSLKDEDHRPWLIHEILFDIMNELAIQGDRGPIDLGVLLDAAARALPIEDLNIDDDGATAMSRALAFLPEIGVFIKLNGGITFFNRSDGSEAVEIAKAGPEFVGLGHLEIVQNRQRRPRKIHVLFTRESEMRFDFAQKRVTVSRFSPVMDMVMPLPDIELTIAGVQHAQGSYVKIDQNLFDAWGAPLGGSKLTDKRIRRAFMPYLGLWSAFLLAGKITPDVDWESRIAAIDRHYRQTFRIARVWMDRILSLKAYRIAVIDQETGTRGPAVLYSNYATVPTLKHYFRGQEARQNSFYLTNVRAYPLNDRIDPETKAAPATVSIVDADQGIIQIDWKLDPARTFDKILPGLVDSGTVPKGDMAGVRSFPIGFNLTTLRSKIPELEEDHKMSIIISAVPASPNSNQQLHKITVGPQEIQHLLPQGAKFGAGEALGPDLTIRVGAGKEVARIGWNDEFFEEYHKIFGVIPGEPNVGPMLLNEDVLLDLARAEAAREYATHADRHEGAMSGDLNRQIVVSGRLHEVAFVLEPDGVAKVELQLPGRIPQISALAFLDGSSREMISRLVQR